jgi:DNA-binding transcriptional ArsR family regulator
MKEGMTNLCYGFFSTLANPTRLAIIELLFEKPMSVNEIVEKLEQEQSMISHNLRPLTRCKLVKRKRDGKNNIYYLNHETIDPILTAVENHAEKFCGNGYNCPLKKGAS